MIALGVLKLFSREAVGFPALLDVLALDLASLLTLACLRPCAWEHVAPRPHILLDIGRRSELSTSIPGTVHQGCNAGASLATCSAGGSCFTASADRIES